MEPPSTSRTMMNKKMITVTTLTAAAVLAIPVLLSAQPEERPGAEHFASADTNGDGLLSLDEFLEASASRLASVDTNADGVVSSDELESAGGRFAARAASHRMERADTDGDGQLSRDELESAHALHFERADGDGDGFVSMAEMREARRGHRSGRVERLRELDTDGDRQLTREEAEAGDLDFDRLDRNGDGVLNRDDRPSCDCDCDEASL